MKRPTLVSSLLILSGVIALPASAEPLTMEISGRTGMPVVTLVVGQDAEVGGRYTLEVTDSRGNRSMSSGTFAPGRTGPVATISLQADARAHLTVFLDNGTSYERDWLGLMGTNAD